MQNYFILFHWMSLSLMNFLFINSFPFSNCMAKYPKFQTICASSISSSSAYFWLRYSGEAVDFFQVKGVYTENY